jgi:beta-glucosidase
MEYLLFDNSGYGDIPKTPSKIEYDDEDRSEFLQNYLEVLYLSVQ